MSLRSAIFLRRQLNGTPTESIKRVVSPYPKLQQGQQPDIDGDPGGDS